MQRRMIKKKYSIQWKKKDNIAVLLIIFVGLGLTFIGSYYNEFYNIFFSTCVGLFFGGIILSAVSTFLAQMESNVSGVGDVDAEIDVDVDVDVDAEIDVDVDVDVDAEIDVDVDVDIDIDAESEIDTDLIATVTPAPIMLLFSSGFLIFGISGIILYQLIEGPLRFIIIFIAPSLAYLTTKIINYAWKIIAKSRYYRISSTQNLLGIQGEVLLQVDNRGGIIKVPSNTPLKFEKIHVKPVFDSSRFKRGEKVYICDVKNGYLLVDNNKKSIKRRR